MVRITVRELSETQRTYECEENAYLMIDGELIMAKDCYSRARWVREQTAQGIPLDELELKSAKNLCYNAFKLDFDSAATELPKAIAENQTL